MGTFGYFMLGIAALPYLVIPILIWSTQRFTTSIELRRIEENFLPKDVQSEFQLVSTPLISRFFETCFSAYTHDDFLGLRFYHRVLLNRVQKTWAICTAICDEDGTLQRKYIELRSQFSTQASLSTHNSDLIGAPINLANRKLTQLPMSTEPDLLLTVHLLGLKKTGLEQDIEVPDPNLAFETLQRFVNQDHEDQVDLGAIYFDEKEKMYRPTWAGAILIGWYSMWPLTYLRRLNSRLKIRYLMKEIASTNT